MTELFPPRSKARYFLRGFALVCAVERALQHSAQEVLAFILVVGAFVVVHRVLFDVARRRLEAVARARFTQYPAPALLAALRLTVLILVVVVADQFWPLAGAVVMGGLLVSLGEILFLRLALRRTTPLCS